MLLLMPGLSYQAAPQDVAALLLGNLIAGLPHHAWKAWARVSGASLAPSIFGAQELDPCVVTRSLKSGYL